MKSGELTTKVVFEQAQPSQDQYGGEALAWDGAIPAWAKVLYGTGQERRQAAQESAEQTATVIVRHSVSLASLDPKDRVSFGGGAWDIVSIVPIGINDELHFTVKRAV